MDNKSKIESLTETIDHIIITTFRSDPFETNNVERNRKLYGILRKKAGRPLTLVAAEGLVKNVKEGSYVIIVTGSVTLEPVMVMPRGETCGRRLPCQVSPYRVER